MKRKCLRGLLWRLRDSQFIERASQVISCQSAACSQLFVVKPRNCHAKANCSLRPLYYRKGRVPAHGADAVWAACSQKKVIIN